MATFQYTAGARTRNIVNIAEPGAGTVAYTGFANVNAPALVTDGFKNFHSQKTLHVVLRSSCENVSDSALLVAVTLYGYNLSLGGIWLPITMPISVGNADVLDFRKVELRATGTTAVPAFLRAIVPIEGIERIAAKIIVAGGRDDGNYDVYFGVNSI